MSQNSKLSEALAATLLRFKEIDRDTIESLCKRAASLEHQVTQNTADINRETTLRSMLDDSQNAAAGVRKSHSQLQWALRDLLAQTRDLNDSGPDGQGYQSEALEHAIAVADALVGEKATEQYPIADEPLNRRIQELEVRLSRAEEPDLPQPLSYDAAMSIAQNGTDIVGFMRGANWMLDQVKGKHKHTQISERHSGGKVDSGLTYGMGQNYRSTKDLSLKWSENALRKLMEDVLTDRESELATSFNETRGSMDGFMATTFKQAQENLDKLPRGMDLKSVITVTGDDAIGALVKDIINTETRPGGRIHKALINH